MRREAERFGRRRGAAFGVNPDGERRRELREWWWESDGLWRAIAKEYGRFQEHASRIMGSRADGEDVTQDFFERFRTREKAIFASGMVINLAYLHRGLHNMCIDRLRRLGREQGIFVRLANSGEDDGHDADPPGRAAEDAEAAHPACAAEEGQLAQKREAAFHSVVLAAAGRLEGTGQLALAYMVERGTNKLAWKEFGAAFGISRFVAMRAGKKAEEALEWQCLAILRAHGGAAAGGTPAKAGNFTDFAEAAVLRYPDSAEAA